VTFPFSIRNLLRALILAATVASACAAKIGDTYDQVIAEKGPPSGKIEGGSIILLRYPDATYRLKGGVVVAIKSSPIAAPAEAPAAETEAVRPRTRIQELRDNEKAAARRVREIVNRPATQVAITPGMKVGNWGDAWFHPGAEIPDFDTVDVRASQETQHYAGSGWPYATSNLNPGVAFPTDDLAFNSKTKLFYTDRSVPKRKLTEDEMLEVNRQYRIIGQCIRDLAALGSTGSYDEN
jgi:hypothetical protein